MKSFSWATPHTDPLRPSADGGTLSESLSETPGLPIIGAQVGKMVFLYVVPPPSGRKYGVSGFFGLVRTPHQRDRETARRSYRTYRCTVENVHTGPCWASRIHILFRCLKVLVLSTIKTRYVIMLSLSLVRPRPLTQFILPKNAGKSSCIVITRRSIVSAGPRCRSVLSLAHLKRAIPIIHPHNFALQEPAETKIGKRHTCTYAL